MAIRRRGFPSALAPVSKRPRRGGRRVSVLRGEKM